MKFIASLKATRLALFAFALLGVAQKADAHGVQVAYGTTPTGFVRIYIEHWHGALAPSNLGASDDINVTVTTSSGSSTFNVDVSGTVNNTTLANLPGLTGAPVVLSAGPSANTERNWGYWDFAPGTCNQPISIRINQGNSVIFSEESANIYPVTIAAQTFTDQAGPVITAPNVTVPGGCLGTNVNYSVSVTDDCDPNPAVTYSIPSGSFFNVGTTPVTVTARDNTGKVTVKTFNVIVFVNDTTAPVLTVPASFSVNAAAGLCGANVTFTTSATDDCSTATVVNTPASGSFFAKGTTSVRSVATDANGNSTTKFFNVTVVDTQAPTITAPANIVANTAAGTCAATVNFAATASDNCPGVSISYSKNPGTSFAKGSTVVTATATDAAGLTATATFTVTVVDTQAPTITTAATGATVACDANTAAALSAWLASNGGAAAVDACGPVTWSNNFSGLSGSCGAAGAATVVFAATDLSGNTTTTTATFTVVDTTAPTITTAASALTLESAGASTTAAISAWLASNGGASATDSCSTVTWSNDYSGLTDGCGATGTATVIFVAKDACGNYAKTQATITVVDTKAPTLTAASDLTVQSDGAGNLAALNTWLANHGGATATDIGGLVTWTNNFASVSDGCGTTGSATVTFTATDECGNAASTTATFTIKDTIAPTINTAAANQTVESDGAGNVAALSAWLASFGGATASDVGSAVTMSHNYVAGSLSDGCGSTGAVTVTFTATDACGNASSSTATFTIVDTTKPVLTSNVRNISPNERPVTFTVSSSDIGGTSTPTITSVTATRVNGSGKTLNKTEPYKHSVSGNKVTIEISGGVDTVWTISASAVDECGNVATAQFVVNVVNPTLTK